MSVETTIAAVNAEQDSPDACVIATTAFRRGARVGIGAVLCPAVEIGAEAFVGAGAVVVNDVPPAVVVVGNPARVLRAVPPEELLSADG